MAPFVTYRVHYRCSSWSRILRARGGHSSYIATMGSGGWGGGGCHHRPLFEHLSSHIFSEQTERWENRVGRSDGPIGSYWTSHGVSTICYVAANTQIQMFMESGQGNDCLYETGWFYGQFSALQANLAILIVICLTTKWFYFSTQLWNDVQPTATG